MEIYYYLEEITKQLDSNVDRIHFICTKFPYRGVNWTYYHSSKNIIVEWMRQQNIRFEQQEVSGQFYQLYRDLYKVERKSVEAQLRFENLLYKSVFKCNYTDNYILSFSQNNYEKQRIIFSYMNYIAQGYFRKIKDVFEVIELPYKGQELEKMFAAKVLPNRYIVFMITIQQTPVQNNQKVLAKIDFTQVIVFLDIITPAQLLQLQSKTHTKTYNKVIADYIKENGYILNQRMLNPYKTDETNIFEYINGNYRFNYEDDQQVNNKPFSESNPFYDGVTAYTPNRFYPHKFQKHDEDTYYYDTRKNRWVLQNQDFLKELQSVKEYQEQVSNYVISQCLNFGSAQKLVDVLQRIPNFKVKLSSEQSHIISCSGNVVCIGRSGTGKTTSAVLRMFALEMLFKYRLSVYHKKHSKSLEKTRFNPKDIDKNLGLRCIFVTASPVLTNEIKRYYDRLTKQLKEELIKRDEQAQAKELEKQIELKKEREQQEKENETQQDREYDEEKEEVELLMEKQFESLQLKKEISTEDNNPLDNKKEEEEKAKEEKITFEDDDAEKLQKEMDKYENLQSMAPEDFPAFMTVRNLVMLIDASITYPFFKRNKDGKIKGQTAQNTWHNEQKGTLYITNNHKNQTKIGQLDEKDGFSNLNKLPEVEDDDDDDVMDTQNLNEFQIGERFRQTMRNEQKKINEITAQKMKQTTQLRKMSYEVDFEYFKRFFWKRVQNRLIGYKNLDAHFVWTEIYSNIKGSADSFYYWGGHTYGLSKYMYSQQQTRLNENDVNKLYEIFNEYEVWKNNEGCYDFMDIVNYIIRAMNYGYNRSLQYLHYIMVDEVQDLPMNVLYLMKKIATNGIFYSGDTAQTIAQGVGFRYGSLKSLFTSSITASTSVDYNKQASDNVTIQQLTINFRSHNRILYLANSVIDLLEFFFPETIDRLKKEKSSVEGPKPIILGDSDPDLLFCILTGEQNFKSERHSENQGKMGRNPIEFGCSQVVLVRNQESKKNLPPMLSHALCLTIYEAKGLEFDDVILYNFFEDSPMDSQKWNLLRYIQYSSKYMNTNQYDEMISEQEIERVHRLHYIQIMRRDIIEQEWKDKMDHSKLQFVMDNVERQNKLTILNNRTIQRQKKMEELAQQEQALQSDAVYGIKMKGQEDLIKVVKIDVNRTEFEHNKISQKDYSQLCSELKQLYVAITRPKNRVIIYDQNSESRNIIQEYWENLGCVEVITAEVIAGAVAQKNVNESGINIEQALLRKSDTNQWKQQGMRMMKMRYYQQAMLCFEKAGCEDYMKQAHIFHLADHAKEQLEDAQREQIFLDQGIMEYSGLNKSEKEAKQNQIHKQLRQARKEFTLVGEEFFNRGQFKQAAKCFFSSLNYLRAADSYLKIDNKRAAAECYYLIQDYNKAAELFLEINEYIKAIECMDICEQWGRILEIINLAKGRMSFKTREIYIKRYAPLALEELVSNIGLSKIEVVKKNEQKEQRALQLIVKEQINEEDEEEASQEEDKEGEEEQDQKEEEVEEEEIEEKDQSKKEKQSVLDELNQEEKEDEQEEEEDSCDQIDIDDLSNEDKEESIEKINQANKTKQSKANVTQDDSINNIDFSIVDKSKSQLQDVSVIEKSVKQSKHDNTSFIDGMSFNENQQDDDNEDLNLSNLTLDFIKSKNQLSDFDHLSEIDPEDEWLKMETGSIAEIIQKSRNSGIFSCSEFSSVNMIDMVNTKTQMIKTSADIFIQDEIMQQVIKYMTMFSDNFKSEILKIKSKDALLTSRNQQNDETLTEQGANDLLIDLDNIDLNFLYLILDTLEYYNIFRLAIFVCNRYKLTKKVGRYLISIAHKFSFLAFEESSLDFVYINPTPQKQKRVEKTMIANIAIHNLFEVINPEFIRLKEADEIPDENNSLGIEVYRGFLSLGYWKKILFIMDYKRSLNLAYYFSDFNNYKTIFLNFNKKYKNKASCISSIKQGEPNFECLPFEVPQTEDEIEFAIVALEHIVSFQNSKPKLSKSTTHNLSFNTRSLMIGEGQYDKIPQFPSYFTYNAIFWKYINHKISKQFSRSNEEDRIFFQYVGKCCKNALEILDKHDKFENDLMKLRVFDVFSFISNLLFQLQFQDKLAQILLQHLDLDDFLHFIQVINRILKMYQNVKIESCMNYLILRALLCPLKARLNINNSDLFSALGQARANVHKSSRLISHFLSYKQNVSAKLTVPQIHIKIYSFEDFCVRRYGKVHKNHEKDYVKYKKEQHQFQEQIKALLLKGDKRSITEASYLVTSKEDKDNLLNYIKEIEFLEKKMRNRYYFLDLDCEYISSPLEDIIEFYKDNLYKLAIPIAFRKISTSVKLSGTKTYTIERLFQQAAYSIAYSELMKETDFIMGRNEGDQLLNKNKDYVAPDYKKYKKSNPLYKFFKFEYLKKLEEENEEEEDEEIQQYLEFEGIRKKTKKTALPLLKKCKRLLSSCLQKTFQGFWNVSLDPYVRNVLLKNALKVIQRDQVQISFDLKSTQKYAQLLNLLTNTHYLYNIKSNQVMKKDVYQIIENVYNHRNGQILKYVNNTLNIVDKHFDQIEVTEKLHQLEYCAIWATVSYLASKNESFNFFLSQNYLKLLPPLKFSEFTTDQKDDNKISVPARFSLEISVQPIQSLDIIVEIFQFINDIFSKQSTQIVQRKLIFTRLLTLIFIILYNLKKINSDLAQEILNLLDVIDAEEKIVKILDRIEFWEDLVQSRDEKEIEELIPLMINDNLFAFDENYEKSDIVQEIYIENIIINSMTEQTRELITKQQILKDQTECAKRINASKIILSAYNYNKQEMWKSQARLCKNPKQILLLSRFNNKYQLPNSLIVAANLKNSQLFHFFEENDNLISDILCNITINSVFDPLDYHYLLLLLEQADRKQEEFEKLLVSVIKNNDQSQNQQIQKLVQETIKKKEELLKWASIQFSKENEDPQVYFLQNKMSIAVKWAKLGYFSDAKKLVENINNDFKLKEAQSLKLKIQQPQQKVGNKFKKNQVKKTKN